MDQAITRLESHPKQSLLNLTDPDAPLMKGKKGNFETNYNIQIACSPNQLISYCQVVTQGNDKAQLIPALRGVSQNTGQKIKTVLADADYGTYEALEYMAQQNIIGYVPYSDMNTQYKDQPFHSSHFVYDPQQDHYTCPAGQRLTYYQTRKNEQRKQSYKKYRVKHNSICKGCSLKEQCLRKRQARRVIQRESRQHLKDQMKSRLNSQQGQIIYRQRLHPVESFFGHIKQNLSYSQFLLRGLDKVRAEFILICLSYNIRKWINLTGKIYQKIIQHYHKQQVAMSNMIVILNMSMNLSNPLRN